MGRTERRILDARGASDAADNLAETVRKPTRVLLCSNCGARIETEAPYDKCPKCDAPGSSLLQERRVRDNG